MSNKDKATERQKKIQLLKDFEAGKITLEELKQDGQFDIWLNLHGTGYVNREGTKTMTLDEMAERQKSDRLRGKEWASITLDLTA